MTRNAFGIVAVALAFATFAGALPSAPRAHEGHDHAADAPALAAPGPARIESSGTALEVVVVADGHTLTLFLDRAATNEPVSGASIEVSGEGIAAIPAKALGEGVYTVEASWLDEPGRKPLTFLVTAGNDVELLNGVLEIPAAEATAGGTQPSFREALGLWSVWMLSALALLVGFALAFAFRPVRLPGDEPVTPARGSGPALAVLFVAGALLALDAKPAGAHEGHDHGADASGPSVSSAGPRRLADGDIFLPKPSQRLFGIRTAVATKSDSARGVELVGTVISDPSTAGQVQAPMDGLIELAQRGISYVGQRVDVGEVLAMLTPTIPVADRGTLQQLTAEVEGKLRIAEQRLARLTRIAGVVPQKDIEDTQAELEALREQKRVLAPKSAEKIALKAPTAGIISVANVRPGQVVNARETLFEIVDPAKLWVEAIGLGGHAHGEFSSANAVDSEGHVIRLAFVGQAPTLRQQSLPLLFRVEDRHDELSIGASVKVVARGVATSQGVLLPDAAVVRGSNGLPQVWTKVAPERFRAMAVKVEPVDAVNVLVTGGLAGGERVVVQGAEFLNQVR